MLRRDADEQQTAGTLRNTSFTLLIETPPNPPGNYFYVQENVFGHFQGHGDSGGGCFDANTGQLYGITTSYLQDQTHPWEVRVTSAEFFRDWVKTIIGSHIGVFNNGSWWLDYDGSRSWTAADRTVTNFGAGLQPVVLHGGAITTTDTPRTLTSHIGAFYPPGPGNWYVDASDNYAWGTGDTYYPTFGGSGDVGVSGFWGTTTNTNAIGVFRSGSWFLDINRDGAWNGAPPDMFFSSFGAGITPVVGSWTASALGRTRIGAFDGQHWYLDINGDGVWNTGDQVCTWGQVGDKPVVGDWNGDGVDEIGTYNNGTWWLDMNGTCAWDAGDSTISGFGQAGDTPIAGRWH